MELTLGQVTAPLSVLDISVGGIGVLVTDVLAACKVGDDVVLTIWLRGGKGLVIRSNVRHIGPRGFGVCGLLFQDLTKVPARRFAAAWATYCSAASISDETPPSLQVTRTGSEGYPWRSERPG